MAAKTKNIRQVDSHHKPAVTELRDSNGNTLFFEAQFPYEVRECDKSWIVYSPHFKTIGYSNKNEAAAIEDFRDSIQTFFDIHLERGTLEKALIDFGWSKKENLLHKPKLFNRPAREGVKRGELNPSQLQLA